MLLNVCRHADKSVRHCESPGETLFVSGCNRKNKWVQRVCDQHGL